MTDATCKTCPWFDPTPEQGKDKPDAGYCRINPPSPTTDPNALNSYGEHPWMTDGTREWCGSHPDRQPRLECATTTLVGRETFPTESDMRRIVDALEKIATCAAVKR